MLSMSLSEIRGPAEHVHGFRRVNMYLDFDCLNQLSQPFYGPKSVTQHILRLGGGLCFGFLYQLKIRPHTWEVATNPPTTTLVRQVIISLWG